MLIWKNQQTVYNPKPGNWSACHEEEADFYNLPTHNCTNPKPSTTNTQNSEAAKPHFLSNSNSSNGSNGSGSTRVLFLLHENFCFLSNITKESRKRTPTLWRLSPLQRCVFQTQRDVLLLFSLEMEKTGKKSWRKPEQKQTERTILSSPIALHPHCVPPPSPPPPPPPPPSPPLAPPPSSTQQSPTTREEKLLHRNKNSRGYNCQDKTTKWRRRRRKRRRRWFRCYSYPAAAILIS